MTAPDPASEHTAGGVPQSATSSPTFDLASHAAQAWEWYRNMGSPQYVCAPMVDQSELAFRLLCRRYGTQLAYSPMVHAACYLREKRSKRNDIFFCNTTPEDYPLIVQLCGNDPEILLAAAKEICRIDGVCAIDLNLGCPQGIARKGKYGAFLLHQTDLVVKIVSTLAQGLDKPVTCKIRLLPSFKDTMSLCHALVAAGCSLLTVHGRTKDQNKHLVGMCDWEMIRRIKEEMVIPVFANGGISDLDDVLRCMEATGVDGVMSSEALLENPGLFSRNMRLIDQHPPERLKCVRAHVFKMAFTGVQLYEDLRDNLVVAETVEEIKEVVREIRRRAVEEGREEGVGERSWYWRHWTEEKDGGGESGVLEVVEHDGVGEEGFDGMGCLFGGEEGD
ncbi:dihydrouridine synthase [Nannochloropsis oceanica]